MKIADLIFGNEDKDWTIKLEMEDFGDWKAADPPKPSGRAQTINLDARESDLAKREAHLAHSNRLLREKEQELKAREAEVDRREKELGLLDGLAAAVMEPEEPEK